jgi:hypothetical protein
MKLKPYMALSVSPAQRNAIVLTVKQLRSNCVIWFRERSMTTPARHVKLGRRTSCASNVPSQELPCTVPAFCHWLAYPKNPARGTRISWSVVVCFAREIWIE